VGTFSEFEIILVHRTVWRCRLGFKGQASGCEALMEHTLKKIGITPIETEP
jgi:hypothetical protein